jgi:CheY-like chemotaxis protein
MKDVLIVDDDADARLIMKLTCQTLGLKPHEAHDGLQALAAVRKSAPGLIILDLSMPNMDGATFLAEIRADPTIPDDIPVLIFTAHSLSNDQAAEMDIPASRIITKAGRNVEELRDIIQQALNE